MSDNMECPNCNKTYDDDFKFCPYCGEEKPEPKICPTCEMEPSVEFSFCPECGTELVSKFQWRELKRKEELNKLNKQIRDYKKLGEYEEAIECYDKLIEIEPENYLYWSGKGYCLSQLDLYDEEKWGECYYQALICCNKAIELNPNDEEALYYKATYSIIFGGYEEAIECYDKLIEIDPSNRSIYEEWKYNCLMEHDSNLY